MRILILVDCYLPKISAGAELIDDLATEFVRTGHEVTILTPLETIAAPFELTSENGFRVARVRTGKIKGSGKLYRAVQEFRLSSILWRRSEEFLRAYRADLIVFYSPSIFFGSLVHRLKELWSCQTYLILRDIFPQWAVDAGILRKGVAWRVLRRKELEQYRAADTIGVQSPSNLHYFTRELPRLRARLEVLYNWISPQRDNLPTTSFRKQWGLEGKVVFVYGGNIGVAQDLDNILKLAESVASRQDIRFLLVGSGSETERLERAMRSKGLPNIQMYPPLPPRTYLAMLTEFDVGLISLDRRLTTHNVPGKLLGYLYSGMPVLASLNPGNDLFDMLEHNGAGFARVTGDDSALSDCACRLADNQKLRQEMGRKARHLMERFFSVEAAASQIIAGLASVPGGAVFQTGKPVARKPLFH